MPPHLEKEEKNALEEIKEYALGGKEKLRGCDYRLAAVIVAQYLRGKNCMHTHEIISLAKLLSNLKFTDPYISFVGKVRPKVQTLLDSLTELSRLLYLPEQSRCPKSVLRLHNQAFIYAMVSKEIIGKPKVLTERKFYGIDTGIPSLHMLENRAELFL